MNDIPESKSCSKFNPELIPESKSCSKFNPELTTTTVNGVTTVQIHLPGFKEDEVVSVYDETHKCIRILGKKCFTQTIPLRKDDFETKFDKEFLTITIPKKKNIASSIFHKAEDVKGGLFLVMVVAGGIVAAGAFLTYRLISTTRLEKSKVT